MEAIYTPQAYCFVLRFSKVLRKLKLSEPHTRAQWFYKNGSTTTKNEPYFVRLVGRLVE